MQLSTLKNSFLSLTLVALASFTSSVLTACSTPASQNQVSNPTTTATDTSDKQPMNHDGSMMNHGGGMNHNMAMDLGSADANYEISSKYH
ncbi:hypothetical protein [Komarekiella delphini-convector]|uniref:hypothetical protein n=1 Tax=Komarekiella delphini-convector TaxID=3050158 RepID=UPI003D69BA1A